MSTQWKTALPSDGLTDALAVRFHEGMTRAIRTPVTTPAAYTAAVLTPAASAKDVQKLEVLVAYLEPDSHAAEVEHLR